MAPADRLRNAAGRALVGIGWRVFDAGLALTRLGGRLKGHGQDLVYTAERHARLARTDTREASGLAGGASRAGTKRETAHGHEEDPLPDPATRR